jgi:protein-disulfide isomerase
VNEDIQKEYDDYIQSGVDIGISGTPSFIVNGEYTKKSPSGKQFFTLESMEEVFLPLLGEEAPKADATEEKSE